MKRSHNVRTRVNGVTRGLRDAFQKGRLDPVQIARLEAIGFSFSPRESTTSLADARPDLAAEWHPEKNGDLTPCDVGPGSVRRVWWRHWCEETRTWHEWQARVDTRSYGTGSRSYGGGCPYCAGRKVLPGFNDLATLRPDVAKTWHPTKNGGLTPENVTVGSKKKVWWLGACGHKWQASVKDRTSGRGCPYCSGRKALPGFNDLASVRPDLATEWHPTKNGDLTPREVTSGSKKKVWWRCARGHEWQASVVRRSLGSGCPYCSGRKVLPGFNDLATLRPDVAKTWHPTKNGDLTPREVTSGSNRKVWWLGECGHEWNQTVYHRTHVGRGCPYCCSSRARAVVCVETGKRYPSARAASREVGVSDSTVQEVLDKPNRTAAGFHWRCAPPEENEAHASIQPCKEDQ